MEKQSMPQPPSKLGVENNNCKVGVELEDAMINAFKVEGIATQAMKGMLSSSYTKSQNEDDFEILARDAVLCAKALIKEMEKQQ